MLRWDGLLDLRAKVSPGEILPYRASLTTDLELKIWSSTNLPLKRESRSPTWRMESSTGSLKICIFIKIKYIFYSFFLTTNDGNQ